MSTSTLRVSAFTEPERPRYLQICYSNLAGAAVDVTGGGEHTKDNRWTCRDCKDSSDCPQAD
ncbi:MULTISPECIES: hypothetical protein [unclassified Streptomyces]|uniref:hypothetical protein n=1 Tax=unclassified Streptomyces TaxID=2593676 RepID=UPI0038058C04